MNDPRHVLIIWLRARWSEAQIALMLLTRLPAGRLTGQAPALADGTWAFPLVGLVVGLIGAITFAIANAIGLAIPIAVGLALAMGVLATGGLHEDGLADVADGFGGGRDKAHKLDIMRDSRIGSYGTLALILSMGLRWSAQVEIAQANTRTAIWAMIAIAVASRAGLAPALLLMPTARPDGLGRAATTNGALRPALAIIIALIAVSWMIGPVCALVLGLLLAAVNLLFGRLSMRKIGGQTGDVLGAMQQLGDLAAWAFMGIWVVIAGRFTLG